MQDKLCRGGCGRPGHITVKLFTIDGPLVLRFCLECLVHGIKKQ